MYGDGCLSNYNNKYVIYISGNKKYDFEYHQNTIKLFKDLFNKDVKINFRKNENTLFIRFSDKEIFNYFVDHEFPIGKKYNNLQIPFILNNVKYFNCFVRGLFDTDGCIILTKQHKKFKYYPRIEITSKSKIFLDNIIYRLKIQGFYGSISNKGKGFRLELPGFKNLELWIRKIGSNHPIKNKKIIETFINKRQSHDFNAASVA